MRKTIRDVLIGTPSLVAIVPAARWYQAGAVLDKPLKPFVVLRWLAPVSGNATNRLMRQLRIDVHDSRGSYAVIEQMIGSPDRDTGIYKALNDLQQHIGSDGRITQCDYLGHSGDQEDLTYGTNMMFSSWRVIGADL